mmetsp:Transcript_31677/g.92913  ORF Transcript_31677/g.92913 Transcript_31677/m.92913 type:complete len:1125 (+) Transcript_31677:97-3471(+)
MSSSNARPEDNRRLTKPPSKAHEQSERFVIDPAYSSTDRFPLCKHGASCNGIWVYGDGELESYRLSVLRRRVKEAKLKVWYPGIFLVSRCRGIFRLPISELPLSEAGQRHFKFKSNDRSKVKAYLSEDSKDEKEQLVLYQAAVGDLHTVNIQNDGAHFTFLNVEVDTRNPDDDALPEPPVLFICNDNPSCFNGAVGCEWRCDEIGDERWSKWSKCLVIASSVTQNPPHAAVDPSISMDKPTSLKVSNEAIIHDFSVELYGRVEIKCYSQDGKAMLESEVAPPRLFVGESVEEALDDNIANQEQSTELVLLRGCAKDCQAVDENSSTWVSVHLLAFRFVRIDMPPGTSTAVSVSCEASFRPVQYKGAFASSDEVFNKIWMHSAYTLRMCMHHDFLLDGMKRDRLPWAGDLAISLLSNAYTFADADIVARSLTVLGRAGIAERDINGFLDYSLWWIICNDLYQTYFGDMRFLHREWHRLKLAVENLISRCDHRGLLVVDTEKRRDMVFIDWVDINKFLPLQVLWWWALDSASSIANRVGCCEKATWKSLRDGVRERLVELFWDDSASLWRASSMSEDGFSRHACILSVVSGLVEPNDAGRIAEALLQDGVDDLQGSVNMRPVATPYMKMFECLALSRAGKLHVAVDKMRRYWSAMLDNGASTFYEAFSVEACDSDKTQASFYGRPFGNSLCHAWSSGPCNFISGALFGIQPLSDGWRTWTCNFELPFGFDWASLAIPSPHGLIELEFKVDNSLRISVPSETTLLLDGREFVGPQIVVLPSVRPDRSRVIDDETILEWSQPYRDWHYYPHLVIPAKPTIPGYEGVYMTDVPSVYQIPGKESKWYMTFIGFDGNGYQSFVAESSDLINWTNFRLAFGYGKEGDFDFGGRVLGGYLFESYNVNKPRVLKRLRGKFWCLYGAYSKQGSYEIDPGYEGLCSSEDGITWSRAIESPILSVCDGDAKAWESGSIYQPWLITDGKSFYNFYNAKRMPEWIEQIGVASSNDLIDWQRNAGNPIVKVFPNDYDSQFCSDPKVYSDGNHWVMFYFGLGKEGKASIMVAHSRDLLHWTKDKEPLYPAGGHPQGFDQQHAHKTSLVYNASNKTYYLFYCAVGNKGRGVGLLTSRPLDTG